MLLEILLHELTTDSQNQAKKLKQIAQNLTKVLAEHNERYAKDATHKQLMFPILEKDVEHVENSFRVIEGFLVACRFEPSDKVAATFFQIYWKALDAGDMIN